MIDTIATFVGGIAVGFGVASYGAMRLLAVASSNLSAREEETTRWRKLVNEIGAHLTHTKRMLEHARKSRAATKILGLPEGATQADVRRAFRAVVPLVHPDHGGDPRVFQLVVRIKDAALRETEDRLSS